MAQAILIVDATPEMKEGARILERYLKKEAGLRRVRVYRLNRFSGWEILQRIGNFLAASARDEPTLVSYHSHGSVYGCGWAWDRQTEDQVVVERLFYGQLLPMVLSHVDTVLFLNNCCYAMRLKVVAEIGLVQAITDCKIGLLPSTSTDGQIDFAECPMFIESVLYDWRRRRCHNPFWGIRNAMLNFSRSRIAAVLMYLIMTLHALLKESRQKNGRRWGSNLDHHFFPEQ